MKKIANPPQKIHKLSLKERNLLKQAITEGDEKGILWLEKIRRFISFHNRNLRKISKNRFGSDFNSHLLWFREILMQQINSNDDLQIDSSLINATLIANDACPKNNKYSYELKIFLKKLESKLIDSPPINDEETKCHVSIPEWKNNNLQNTPVTIFCPSPYSLFSITALSICLHLKIPVKAVIILSFSASRIKSELYRDGLKLFVKRVWRKLVLKSDENSDKAKISLKFLKNQLSSNHTDIRELSKLNNINFYSVSNFESSLSLKKNINGDVCLFTGGGLLSQNIIDYFEHGIINVHMGSLPKYKGMDVVEAPILDGCFNDVALTSHLMQKDLDSGPIINNLFFNSDDYRTLGELRNEMGALMPLLAIDALVKLFKSGFKPIPQISNGRQYYFIHSELRKILSKVILSRFNREKSINKKNKCENLKLISSVLAELGKNKNQ